MVAIRYIQVLKKVGISFGKAAVPLTAALCFSSPALADCATRHFYNNSSVPFTLTMDKDAGTCSVGTSANVQQCVVPPRTTAEIHYTNSSVTDGFSGVQNVGTITIQSSIYSATSFRVITGLCQIKHNGNTGNISVNDPVDGDITS